MKVSAVGKAHDITFVSKMHALRTSGPPSALYPAGPAGRWGSTEGIEQLSMIPHVKQNLFPSYVPLAATIYVRTCTVFPVGVITVLQHCSGRCRHQAAANSTGGLLSMSEKLQVR